MCLELHYFRLVVLLQVFMLGDSDMRMDTRPLSYTRGIQIFVSCWVGEGSPYLVPPPFTQRLSFNALGYVALPWASDDSDYGRLFGGCLYFSTGSEDIRLWGRGQMHYSCVKNQPPPHLVGFLFVFSSLASGGFDSNCMSFAWFLFCLLYGAWCLYWHRLLLMISELFGLRLMPFDSCHGVPAE